MSKVSSYILNLILFLALVGGVAFCAPSIKGFASSVPPVPDDYNQVCIKLFKGSYSTTGFDSSKSYICKINSAYNLLSNTWFSSTYIFNVEVEVYLTTTSGTYLIGAESTGRTGTVSLDTSVYYEGYPVSYYAVAKGYLSSSAYYRPSSSQSEGVLNLGFDIVENPSNSLNALKSDTQTIITMLEDLDVDQIYDVVSSIWTYLFGSQKTQIASIISSLTGIDLDLVDIEGAINGTNSRLTDILFEIRDLKKSICYDFPLSIDGNYQLSSTSVVNIDSLNLYYNPDYFSFRFGSISDTSYRFYILVPDSRKIMFVYKRLGTYSPILFSEFYFNNGNLLSTTFEQQFSDYFGRRIYSFPDTVNPGDLVYMDITVRSNASFALYNYVVSANDILNYMKDQWAQSAPAVSDLDDHTSITDGFSSSVSSVEDGYFTSFSSAVDGAGLRGFDWSVFGGMSLFTAFVTGFYNLLPAEFALYITAVLIVGCIAVLISAVGRVVKKGGDNG